MPCSSGHGMGEHYDQSAHEDIRRLRVRLNELEAMLCAIMRALEANGQLDKVLASTDETASGVPVSQMRMWFSRHKVNDTRRG